jgi:hypothetical protein
MLLYEELTRDLDVLCSVLYRHLGGARQDNRIVPFGEPPSPPCLHRPVRPTDPLSCSSLVAPAEGLPIFQMTEPQREQVWAILRAFNCYLPPKALEARMNRLRSVQEETYFAWIGGYGLGDPYYFRIHSPMTFSEVSSGPFLRTIY